MDSLGFLEFKGFHQILWDWNGTLLDDTWLVHEVVCNVLTEAGARPVSLEQFREWFRHPVEDFYAQAGINFSVHPFETLSCDFHRLYNAKLGECLLHQGALGILNAFAGRGFGQSILSAYHERYLKEIVSRLGIAGFFESIAGLDNFNAVSKVERGRLWLKQSGRRSSEVLVIGDTSHDAEVARELGLGCVLVASGYQAKTILEACGVPVADSLAELAALLTEHGEVG